MGGTEKKTISIIVPVYNETPVLSILFDELSQVLERLQSQYELQVLLVDDGSTDDSWQMIADQSAADKRFSGIRLSRNFGHQPAISCGYEHALGDAVVSIDADLQDPPCVIPELIQKWEEGFQVVLAVRRKRDGESNFKLKTAKFFYRLMAKISDSESPAESGDFRLLDRVAVIALKRITESHRYVRGLVAWLGFKRGIVEYDRRPRRAGTTKYPLIKMIRLALDAIVSFSFLPLRAAYIGALILMVPFLAYLIYNFMIYVFFDAVLVPGWSSLILAVILFGSFNLLMIGILGEYVGRIYTEVKRRPIFLISEYCGQNGVIKKTIGESPKEKGILSGPVGGGHPFV